MTIKSAILALKAKDITTAMHIAHKMNSDANSRCFTTLGIEAGCEKEIGNINKALILYEEALKFPASVQQKANILHNIAVILTNSDRHLLAVSYMEELLVILNEHEGSQIRLNLGNIYLNLGKYSKAIDTIEPLLKQHAVKVAALNLLIQASFKQSNHEKVSMYLCQLEELKKELNPDLLFLLVDRYAQINPSKALILIEEIKNFEHADVHHNIRLIEARLLLENQQPKNALELLPTVFLESIENVKYKAMGYSVRAKALDNQLNFQKAFESFELMNEFSSEAINEEVRKSDKYPSLSRLNKINTKLKNTISPLNLAFIVGFPRSGTTLLENILNSQKQLFTLDEKPMLTCVIKKVESDGYKYPSDLANMSLDYLLELRQEYIDSLLTYTPKQSLGEIKLVIDKNPMHMMHIPLIQTLFPSAKFVLALRHPLDAILSCYMQNFNMNEGMLHFADWPNCFVRYQQLFSLYENYKQFLSVDEHVIRYEDLIHQFEVTTESLFKFLEVDYDESYKEFHRLAKKRIVNTASRAQVKVSLYQSSENRYQYYWKFVKPHVDKVAGLIQRFGYEVITK